jgi:hypothetical protein
MREMRGKAKGGVGFYPALTFACPKVEKLASGGVST